MPGIRRIAVCVVLLCVAGCLRPRPAPETDADATTSDGTFDAVVDAADVVVDVSVDIPPADVADVTEPPDGGTDAGADGPEADVPADVGGPDSADVGMDAPADVGMDVPSLDVPADAPRDAVDITDIADRTDITDITDVAIADIADVRVVDVMACIDGFDDCDGNIANGCETNLTTDVHHCGTCGTACSPGQICSVGACAAVMQIAAGAAHACALLGNGTVRCWGQNTSGQLGNGRTTDSNVPVSVTGLGGTPVEIAAGDLHTCARLSDNTLRCWGANGFGELGDGTTRSSFTPVTVTGLGGTPVEITAGDLHTCARLSDDTLRCWGNNDFGELGNGTATGSSVPVMVSWSYGDPMQIASRGFHTCVRNAAGRVYCWGQNVFGELGNGTTMNSLTPVMVSGSIGTPAQLAPARYGHTCSRDTRGNAYCWGRNSNGQLGDGTSTNSTIPVQVDMLGGVVTSIAAGGLHTCAIRTDNVVLCWGRNGYGQLGTGSITDSRVPAAISGSYGTPVQLAGGTYGTCLRSTDGSVFCWGINDHGQLGNGTNTESHVPVRVIGL